MAASKMGICQQIGSISFNSLTDSGNTREWHALFEFSSCRVTHVSSHDQNDNTARQADDHALLVIFE